jgi:hypothetical protein
VKLYCLKLEKYGTGEKYKALPNHTAAQARDERDRLNALRGPGNDLHYASVIVVKL